MTWEAVEKAGLVASIVTASMSIWLTILGVRLTIKPKLEIKLIGSPVATISEPVSLTFHLRNVGHRIFGAPPATDTRVWVNMDRRLDPRLLRYGSQLECEEKKVGTGKDGRKFIYVKNVYLLHGEPGENIELNLNAPIHPGKYTIWITLIPSEGGQTMKRVDLDVHA